MGEEAELKARITLDLKTAMKAGNTACRDALRMLLSGITNAEIAKRAPLTDAEVIGVITKEIKQRQESIDAFRDGNRQDLLDKETGLLAEISPYLPEQVGRDEVIEAARRIIAEVGAEGLRDKGKVMSKIIAELKGKADGREINDVVTELLSA